MAEDTKKETKSVEISAAVKEKYKMKGNFAPGEYRHKGQTINTATCSLEELEAAVKIGFDVVEPVAAKTTPANK